jgi:hypothetical protein
LIFFAHASLYVTSFITLDTNAVISVPLVDLFLVRGHEGTSILHCSVLRVLGSSLVLEHEPILLLLNAWYFNGAGRRGRSSFRYNIIVIGRRIPMNFQTRWTLPDFFAVVIHLVSVTIFYSAHSIERFLGEVLSYLLLHTTLDCFP